MLLYIIRHGDPIYETDSLTERGFNQAQALSKRLVASGIDAIYCSPLGRAKLTAEPTAKALGLEIMIEEWMSEDLAWNSFSAMDEDGKKDWLFAGQNFDFFQDGDVFRPDWYNHAKVIRCPNAKEGYERIQAASDNFIQKLGYQRNGSIYKILEPSEKRIAAFCHHGLGTSWLSHLLSISPILFWTSFNIAHTGVTIIEFVNNDNGITAPKCLVHSDMSHIYESGLPMLYSNETAL